MNSIELISIVIGLNALILVGIIANSLRIGRLEGRLKNGDYLRCPFYRGKGNNPHGKK